MALRKALASVLTLTLLVFAANPAAAALADYTGYATETGGIPPSNPGDELVVLSGVSAANLDPAFGATGEVTIVLSGLISTGQFPAGTTDIVNYTGGTLSMYDDTATAADFGDASTFSDGTLLFEGSFTSFTLYLTGNSGAYEGNLDATGGSALGSLCSDCAYSFAGVFGDGAQIPEGYDLQVDGELQVDGTVDTDDSSFGAVKSLFGN